VITTPAMTIRQRLERDEGLKWLLAMKGVDRTSNGSLV